ncbi:hypothetical protein [Leisingera daeponensis]|uniref:hypothetical protein n=1 Tax=Leisingera daeponensis TaxID=405746 RepID=UPI001376609B|nr:hypothetical protein [Leisingera daeponensis]
MPHPRANAASANSRKGNGSNVPHLFRSMMVGGCTCGEGLLLSLLVQHGIAARLADPKTLQTSLYWASLTLVRGSIVLVS